MELLKTQFEIRYQQILDFTPSYRVILESYLENCVLNIGLPNTPQESATMHFKEENYFFDLRWDRFIFISEGDRVDLIKPQGPFFIFFEIFGKLKSRFPKLKVVNALLQESCIRHSEVNIEEIKARYGKRFFTNEVDLSFPHESIDFSIILDFIKGKRQFKVSFGPFDYKKDVLAFNLSPINKRGVEYFEKYNGLYIDCLYFEPLRDVNFHTYKGFNEIISNYRDKISI